MNQRPHLHPHRQLPQSVQVPVRRRHRRHHRRLRRLHPLLRRPRHRHTALRLPRRRSQQQVQIM